jgi:phenylpyruvate tautomerase PptA (4-oxalocrotonate tautomerase family)
MTNVFTSTYKMHTTAIKIMFKDLKSEMYLINHSYVAKKKKKKAPP